MAALLPDWFPFLKGRFKRDALVTACEPEGMFPFLKGRFKSINGKEYKFTGFVVSIPQRKVQRLNNAQR